MNEILNQDNPEVGTDPNEDEDKEKEKPKGPRWVGDTTFDE